MYPTTKTRTFRGNVIATEVPKKPERLFFEAITREREEARANAKPPSKLLPPGAGRQSDLR